MKKSIVMTATSIKNDGAMDVVTYTNGLLEVSKAYIKGLVPLGHTIQVPFKFSLVEFA